MSQTSEVWERWPRTTLSSRPGCGEPGLTRGLVCTCFSGCSRTRCGHCHPVRHSGWWGCGQVLGGPGRIPEDHGGPAPSCGPAQVWTQRRSLTVGTLHPGAVQSQPLVGGRGWWRPLGAFSLVGVKGLPRPLQQWREGGWGLPEDPTEVPPPWGCRGRRKTGASRGHARRMVTKCPCPPRAGTLGWRAGRRGRGKACSCLGLALDLAAGAPLVGRDRGCGSCPAPQGWSLLAHRCHGSAPGLSPTNVHSLTPPPSH